MTRIALLALATVGIALAPAPAAEKADPKAKLDGTYARTVGDNEISFAFKDALLTLRLKAAGGGTIEAVCDYGVTKDGVLFGVVSKVDAAGVQNPPAVGMPFSFKVGRKEGELVVSDLKGTEDEGAKNLIEGTYKKQ